MRKNTYKSIVFGAILAIGFFSAGLQGIPSALASGCANGTTLSPSEFVAAVGNGSVSSHVYIDSAAHITITNNTDCAAPVSLSVYKMYNQRLSTQRYFSGTGLIHVPAHITQTLTTNLPSCMAQIDAWYGTAPTGLLDSNLYSYPNTPFVFGWGYFENTGAGYLGAQGNFCTNVIQPPPPPQGGVPNATTNPATNVDRTTAQVNGSVGPNYTATSYWFEYGTNLSLGNATVHQSAGAGNITVHGFSLLSGLSENTTHYFRTLAQNSHGITRGSVLSFTTDAQIQPPGMVPLAQTDSATAIGQSTAQLNGSVNPEGAQTSTWFEYGTSVSLGSTFSLPAAGSGTNSVSENTSLSGLQANTVYYYRMVAQNQYGTAHGSILSFTTNATPIQPPAGSAPTAQTVSANDVAANSASLNGIVNPNNAQTSTWFEYGTSASLGWSTAFQSAGSSQTQYSFSAFLSSLQPNTTYYFRIDAQNQYGTTQGSILSFTTNGNPWQGGGNNGSAPTAQTVSANDVAANSASLNGIVNPNNAQTSTWFEYGTSASLGWSTAFQSAGSSQTQYSFSAFLSSLQPNTTYYFRIDAQNQYGTTQGSILSFTTGSNWQYGGGGGGGGNGSAPVAQTMSAGFSNGTYLPVNGQVNPDGYDTVTWFEYGTTPGSLVYTTSLVDIGSGTNYQTVSQTLSNLSQGTTYYFRVGARNQYGTSYGQILNTQTSGFSQGTGAPVVATNPATYIAQNSALMNGTVNPEGNAATGWFEYGPTASLGLQTQVQAMGAGTSDGQLSYAVTGLLPGTTYYFRADAQNPSGTAYGSILSFTTSQRNVATQPPVNPPVVITQPPVVVTVGGSGTECVSITPTLDAPQYASGDSFIYTVTYRNDCNYVLSNTSMKLVLPLESSFTSTNYPYVTQTANTVTYNLGTVPRNFQSAIIVKGTVSRGLGAGYTLLFQSNLSFNDPRGHFHALTAYVSALVGTSGLFSASIFDALKGLLGSPLLALLIILLILFLIFWFYMRKKLELDKKPVATQ